MKYLEFEVKNMAITRASGNTTALISGAVNYFGLHFTFDEEFSEIPGAKSVELSKNKQSRRIDLVDGMCAVPNDLLKDKNAIEFRVLSGNTIATPWTSIGITESGLIMPETPEEEAPSGTEFVKTYTGERAAPLLRSGTNGLEYSVDGENWNSGVSGVPEVPKTKDDYAYLRKNGDWVRADEFVAGISSGGEQNVIDSVKVNGTAIPVEDKSVNIDLSAYAEKTAVDALQTLSGTAASLAVLDYSETDIPAIVSKINEVILLLQSRGIATA